MLQKKFRYFIGIAIASLFTVSVYAQEVAITMDNPTTEASPIISSKAIDKSILAALIKHHLKIILFVQGAQVDSKAGRALLQRWIAADQIFGNHTYSHHSIDEISEQEDEADTLRNERLLSHYANFKKIFRFPFLKEGDTAEKRDAFRFFMRSHHYENGSVTIDTSDWYINDRLQAQLIKDPAADINAYKKYYLEHVWNRAKYYDSLSRKVLGYSPKHTLLMHHNLLNALFLDDLIQMFKNKGWKVINADEAFSDPVFRRVPDVLPAGESLILSLAKETGRYDDRLRYPGEDGSYEKEAMDKLGL